MHKNLCGTKWLFILSEQQKVENSHGPTKKTNKHLNLKTQPQFTAITQITDGLF